MDNADAAWTPSSGGMTVEGVIVWDASDPAAGPEFHFDAETGAATLTAGPNDLVIRYPKEPSHA